MLASDFLNEIEQRVTFVPTVKMHITDHFNGKTKMFALFCILPLCVSITPKMSDHLTD